jgi:hypothetical protein
MLISNENFVRPNFVAAPAVQNSAKRSTTFSLLIERNEVQIENDQSSALSFNALGMFGNFDSINFIESSPPVYAEKNNADFTAKNTQILYKSSGISQYPNAAIAKQKSQSVKYNFSKLTIEYAKNLKNINNLIFKNYINSSINQRSVANFRSVYLSSFVYIHNHEVHERLINPFQLNILHKGGQFFVSLTGSVFDLTNSLKMRGVASSILEKFGIKNGILYINAINVTKAYYFIREENHGSGTR